MSCATTSTTGRPRAVLEPRRRAAAARPGRAAGPSEGGAASLRSSTSTRPSRRALDRDRVAAERRRRRRPRSGGARSHSGGGGGAGAGRPPARSRAPLARRAPARLLHDEEAAVELPQAPACSRSSTKTPPPLRGARSNGANATSAGQSAWRGGAGACRSKTSSPCGRERADDQVVVLGDGEAGERQRRGPAGCAPAAGGGANSPRARSGRGAACRPGSQNSDGAPLPADCTRIERALGVDPVQVAEAVDARRRGGPTGAAAGRRGAARSGTAASAASARRASRVVRRRSPSGVGERPPRPVVARRAAGGSGCRWRPSARLRDDGHGHDAGRLGAAACWPRSWSRSAAVRRRPRARARAAAASPVIGTLLDRPRRCRPRAARR